MTHALAAAVGALLMYLPMRLAVHEARAYSQAQADRANNAVHAKRLAANRLDGEKVRSRRYQERAEAAEKMLEAVQDALARTV